MRIVTFLAVLVSGFTIGGCAPPPSGLTVKAVAIPVGGNAEIIQTELEGRLIYEDQCLLLRSPGSGGPLLVVWQLGTSFDGQTITTGSASAGPLRVRLGERVKISGSLQSWGNVGHIGAIEPFRERCRQSLLFAVQVSRA